MVNELSKAGGRKTEKREVVKKKGLVGLVGFYGISTFVGYLTPNPFLCK